VQTRIILVQEFRDLFLKEKMLHAILYDIAYDNRNIYSWTGKMYREKMSNDWYRVDTLCDMQVAWQI